jgi:hypothetical protein
MSTMNSYIRIVATRCSPGTWFVSGICVDTLYKGNTEDNNNSNNNNNALLEKFVALYSRRALAHIAPPNLLSYHYYAPRFTIIVK